MNNFKVGGCLQKTMNDVNNAINKSKTRKV